MARLTQSAVVARGLAQARRSALAEFIAAKAEFDALLAELAAASADHFGVEPDSVNWAATETLQSRVFRLRDLADSIACRGEYAR